ncbi:MULTISPECIES: TolC family protein [Desulfosporosinus]|uniref:Outer membrane efflux protein n=1 Tax=Desulfosporosinus lacus DSM 15449 TaxID=1121420 RepID=A0A1M5RZ87_9FIRM|nr:MULTISPECIES: TolC family protein [Desulfosporosinus]MDA8221034.1 TolC family protein [Desulfitobacterium hafniense]SHH31546.1 hypothetical protein SAMN02746098_00703 [Desulfosporosinus lacus DSM 15449]
MKKLIGISILSTMLILGQPFMAFADATSTKVINFADIKGIIAEQNIDVQINKNSSLKDKVDFSNIKKNIKDLEDDLEDLDNQRDSTGITTGEIMAINAEKRMLLDALKEYERGAIDRPTLEARIDLNNSMNDELIVRAAESLFIGVNQADLGILTISSSIKTLEKQLVAMQLQESLGMISHNNINELKTNLVNLQTQLESTEFQQASLERQLKNLFNDQENTLVIGSTPATVEDFIIEDEEADLEKALENSYAIKLQELQITMNQATLDRAKKDNGASSKQYKKANYDLTNANLKLTQMNDTLKSNYHTMIDNIAKTQSDLRLAEQTLGDKKVKLSEAQLRKGLGMISQLELDEATTNYQLQENAVKTKQIDLFNAKCNYEWFLKGMPQA